jgi:hypothetical protein
VFARIDHQEGANDAGLHLRPTELLIFGHPRHRARDQRGDWPGHRARQQPGAVPYTAATTLAAAKLGNARRDAKIISV